MNIMQPVGMILSAIVIGASVVTSVYLWKQTKPVSADKNMAITDCAKIAQTVEVRGSVKDDWNVTTSGVNKDTYTFCMKEKGFEVSQ